MDWLHYIEFAFSGAEIVFFLCSVGLALELFRPAQENQPARAIVFNFLWMLNFLVVTNILMSQAGWVITSTVEIVGGPWIDLNLPDSWWGWGLHFLIYLVLYDFAYYWYHRCQHSWPWFWCQHKLHHTDENLNASTSFRHHWLENILRIPFITIPIGCLIQIDSTMPVALLNLMLAWSVFVHLNIKLDLGPLTPVIAGPQYHRIHHSNQRPHQDRNFTAYLPIWDVLFGTYHKPEKDEYPTVGTMDGEQTWSIWDANVGVFRGWLKLLRPTTSVENN